MANTPAMVVVATAPRPTSRMPSLPSAGAMGSPLFTGKNYIIRVLRFWGSEVLRFWGSGVLDEMVQRRAIATSDGPGDDRGQARPPGPRHRGRVRAARRRGGARDGAQRPRAGRRSTPRGASGDRDGRGQRRSADRVRRGRLDRLPAGPGAFDIVVLHHELGTLPPATRGSPSPRRGAFSAPAAVSIVMERTASPGLFGATPGRDEPATGSGAPSSHRSPPSRRLPHGAPAGRLAGDRLRRRVVGTS